MSFTLIADPSRAPSLTHELESTDRIALDCEAAGFHRYSDALCLVQLSTAERTWILDPFELDLTEVLKPVLEDPEVTVVMHGADFDLRLLDRDLDIHIRGLFDTQAAAAMLGVKSLGLSSLLETFLDLKLPKKYQRADWARRPLPEDMLEYAANDTRHLHRLADVLLEALEEKGRLKWALEESRELEAIRFDGDPDEDPVTRVKGARDLPPRELAALREALAWRDRIARERDRAPFRIAGDHVLMEVAEERPSTVEALARIKGMNGSLARHEGQDLLERMARVDARGEAELEPYPPRDGSGPGRPSPEVEELANRLRHVRNRRAEELGMDRGALVSNATLVEIATHEPSSTEALRDVPNMKGWQVEAMGEDLVAALRS